MPKATPTPQARLPRNHGRAHDLYAYVSESLDRSVATWTDSPEVAISAIGALIHSRARDLYAYVSATLDNLEAEWEENPDTAILAIAAWLNETGTD